MPGRLISDDQVEEIVDSDLPRLVIEAPAGHGKTYQAVRAASTAAAALADREQKVLFLTHTNAARDTFNRRLGRAAAHMKTIDSFAASIVDAYATPLGLPRPIDPANEKPRFGEIVPIALKVLAQRPELVRGLALTYPVILVDEFQDCTSDQQTLIDLIASRATTKLRLFGDGFQGIFEFSKQQIDWTSLTKANETTRLSSPWRWKTNPEMAEFLRRARESLEAGHPIDLRSPPSCVSVREWDGPVPGPTQGGHAIECFSSVRELATKSTAVLVQHNEHAITMCTRVRGIGQFHEGSNLEPARALVEKVQRSEGSPPALIECMVEAFRTWGVNMSKVFADQVAEACTESGIQLGSKRVIASFCSCCEPLYVEPTAGRWFDVLRQLLTGAHGIKGWRVIRGDQLYLIAGLRPSAAEDLSPLLHAEFQSRQSRGRSPASGFLTIHKAKGLEFDRVLLPYCAGSLLPDDEASRKRLYVAVTRAQSHITFMIPRSDPTPLLEVR